MTGFRAGCWEPDTPGRYSLNKCERANRAPVSEHDSAKAVAFDSVVGDELIHLVPGEVTVVVEAPGGDQRQALRPGQRSQ